MSEHPNAGTVEFYRERHAVETPLMLEVLRAFPADKLAYKPHEQSSSAEAIFWTIVRGLITRNEVAAMGEADLTPGTPQSYRTMLAQFEGLSSALADKLGHLTQAQWEQTARLRTGGEVVARLVYEATIVVGVEINVDISRELAIFIADHRRSTREQNLGYFGNRDLRPRRCRNQHATQLSSVVAEIPLVTDIDRIATSAFDVFCNVHASNPRLHGLLHVGNGQTVFRRFWTIDLHIDVKALRDPLGENGTHLR